MTLQEYSFEVVLKPGSDNACANALSCWDKLLGKEGVPEPVIVLPSTHSSAGRIEIDIEFAAKVHAKVKKEQPPTWFD